MGDCAESEPCKVPGKFRVSRTPDFPARFRGPQLAAAPRHARGSAPAAEWWVRLPGPPGPGRAGAGAEPPPGTVPRGAKFRRPVREINVLDGRAACGAPAPPAPARGQKKAARFTIMGIIRTSIIMITLALMIIRASIVTMIIRASTILMMLVLSDRHDHDHGDDQC